MATSLTGPLQIAPADIYSNSATQLANVGAVAHTTDGRKFRYVKVGAVATVAGKVYQGPALDATNMQPTGGLTPSAGVAIGGTQITISSSITLAANQLTGGFMSVDVTPGQGYTYKIKGNTAVSGAGGCVVTLEDPLVVAITTDSRIIFVSHPCNGVVIEPGTPTGPLVGVAPCIITAGYYGWLQVGGPAACLFTGTGVAGKAVGSLSGGTSGSLAPCIAETAILGHHMATSISGEYAMINLCFPS